MPTCPKCKKEIDMLIREEFPYVCSKASLNNRGDELDLKEISFEPDDVSFSCPECKETLFQDSADAIKFLKGGKA